MADKKRENFNVCSIITCAVSDNINKATKDAKATIAFYATVKTYRKPFELQGFSAQVEKIRDAYFKRDIGGMIKNVSDEMANSFAIIGSAEYCREKVDEYRRYIDLPILSAPHYFIDYGEVREYQESILETFGSNL